jgi:hypothetical protein
MNRGQLSSAQLFWTALLTMLPTLVLLLPGELLRQGGRWAWWTPLLAALPAAGLAAVAGWLGARGGDLVTAARRVLGPLAGRLLLGTAWVATGAYTVVITRELGEGARATFVSGGVPLGPLALLALLPAGLLAWLGPVVIARVAALVAPFLGAMYLIGLAAAVPVMHAVWALPLLPADGRFASWPALGITWVWLAEPAFLGVLVAHRLDGEGRRRAGLVLAAAALAGAGLLALGLLALVADFGPARAAQLLLPFQLLSEDLAYSPYLEHLDTLVMPIEILAGLSKLAIFLWLWSRLAGGMSARRWEHAALLCLAAAAAILALTLFPNSLAVDRSFYGLAEYALPTLTGAALVPYLAGRPWRRAGP